MSLCFHKTGVSLLDLSCIFYPQKQNYFETENGDNFAETDPVSNLDRAHSYTLTKILLNLDLIKALPKNMSFFAPFCQF